MSVAKSELNTAAYSRDEARAVLRGMTFGATVLLFFVLDHALSPYFRPRSFLSIAILSFLMHSLTSSSV